MNAKRTNLRSEESAIVSTNVSPKVIYLKMVNEAREHMMPRKLKRAAVKTEVLEGLF